MATKLTSVQAIEVNDLLKQHMVHLPNGEWEYKASFNDNKIAKLAGVTYYHVLRLRRVLGYYSTRKPGPQPVSADLETHLLNRCLGLEMRLARIESFMVQDWGYELDPPAPKNNGEDT